MEGVVGVGEGGDVEILGDQAVEFSLFVRHAEGEELHFPVGVGDLGDGGDGFAGFTGNVVEGDGVEGVAEDAGEGEEGDAGVGGDGGAVFGEPGGEVFAGGFFRVGMDVVAVVDGEEVEAVSGEEGEFREIIEVDGEHEDAVGEGVFLRGDAGVVHAAFVEGIFNRQDAKFAKFLDLGI